MQLENRDLRQSLEDKKIEIYFLTERKRELSRQLKEYEGEGSSGGRKTKRRLGVEYYFVSSEEY